MAPHVPMDFGIRLLDSPTHSTLELKASQGKVVKASSVILSFNSPVIDHMTTTLHLTSVDMEEFSEEAVRYFVHAAYTGKTPPISRDMFRDINKMSHVFEVKWLVIRCGDKFFEMADTTQEDCYEDMVFLYEEAAFVLTKLKSRTLLKIALKKIKSHKESFIRRYLEDVSSVSSIQLDLIIELAGTEVQFVVEPLTEQLTASLARGETVVPGNCKYLLENCELYLCQKHNTLMFDQLFDMLEQITKGSKDETAWLYQLHLTASKKTISDDKVIPNLFHTLDCSVSFEEVVNWLGKSELVTNLFMFFAGFWHWMCSNDQEVECTPEMLTLIREIKEERRWNAIPTGLVNQFEPEYGTVREDIEEFFNTINKQEDLCSSDSTNNWKLVGKSLSEACVGATYFHSIFKKETKLSFHFRHPAVKECSEPEKCGIILKTTPMEHGASVILCTDPNDYPEDIHYHNEVKAKDMHFFAVFDVGMPAVYTRILPLSWTETPVLLDGDLKFRYPNVHPYDGDDDDDYHNYTFCSVCILLELDE